MKRLCVIFGGQSVEHDISIITGMQLAKAINEKVKVEKIYLSLDNRFYLATNIKDLSFFDKKDVSKLKELIVYNGAFYLKGVFFKKHCDVDCVINCCHGGVGENGDLASMFEVNGIKYVGSSAIPSHIAMDKSLTKKVLDGIVPTVKGVEVTKNNFNEAVEKIKKSFSKNLIVKPNSLGSSIGVKACNKTNFIEQIKAIFEMNDSALVEEQVVNLKEYNQACFKSKDGLILSAIEQPLTKSNVLTFEDKYEHNSKSKGKDRIIPANISKDLQDEINEYTLKVYQTLKFDGVVRVDYIYDDNKKQLYFNEVNTIPGSMAFYLYEAIGIDYISLIMELIENCKENKKYFYFDTGVLKNKLI